MKPFAILAILCCAFQLKSQSPSYHQYVNPLVGTDGHGHTFPGATLPFGMVQLSPDTRIDGSWDGCGGYHYSDTMIYGFTHTHLSGTGVSDYGDILLMPILSDTAFDNKVYAATFSHQNETATAGYYAVKFKNGIQAELTATTRVGFHQYTFPTGKTNVILDNQHRDELLEGKITIINNTTVAVTRRSKAWATDQHAYAYIVFSKPFNHLFNKGNTKVIFQFNLKKGEALKTKVGFSFVGEEGAKKNLEAELVGWDFDLTKKAAEAAWDKELSKISIQDKDLEKLRTFYTALYHVMIHPNVAMDVDGKYRGRDNQIHQAEGFTYYTVFSLWDTFRAAHPLFALIDKKRTLDFIKTFLVQYQEGRRLPVWELASNETDCMIGYHSVSVMADALAKGIDGFDVKLAFEAMKTSATWQHLGLNEYQQFGFLSIDDEHESVSKTLEYAYDDWCIAQVAQLLGKESDYLTYKNRSQGWKNLLDPETKLMRPRKNGAWLSPFEPREVNNHFTEGNSWQYSFFVLQDIEGMIELMGGKEEFEAKLDELFSASSETTGREQADITGLIGQYAHGNEPSHHIAYLYNYVGKPEKTKNKVHEILKTFYSSKPDGLIGNEDCGQMSAWYVMSSLGLYAVTPGSDVYALTEPYFQDYTVQLESGKTFNKNSITAALKKGNFMRHFELVGTEKPARKQEYLNGSIYVQSPFIQTSSNAFNDSLLVEVFSPASDEIEYYFINENGKATAIQKSRSVYIKTNCTLVAYAIRNVNGIRTISKKIHAKFYKNPHPNWEVKLLSTYTSQYSAGGPLGLVDGIKGNENWRKGDWQGYQGQDFEAIINFNENTKINSFTASFLQDTRSWILMPKKVEFYISEDGLRFFLAATVENTVAAEDNTTQIKAFAQKLPQAVTAKFMKVKAYNYGTLPSWHQGAGYEAYIFLDEVGVE